MTVDWIKQHNRATAMLVRKSVYTQQIEALERQLALSKSSEKECLAIKRQTNYLAISAAGMILESSPQFEALSGYRKAQLTCEHIDNLLSESLTQTSFFQSLLQSGAVDTMEQLAGREHECSNFVQRYQTRR